MRSVVWPPTPCICKNEQEIFCLKTKIIWKHLKKFKTPPPHHFYVDIMNVWLYGPFRVSCDMNFFLFLEKTIILLFEQSIIKILLKHTSKPKCCGSSVKVNSISDCILWNFLWNNVFNVYYTKKKLSSICRILHSLKFQMGHIVAVM